MRTKANAKRAIIGAMAVITGATFAQENAAARAAMADMQKEYGIHNTYAIEYTWDPSDGMIA